MTRKRSLHDKDIFIQPWRTALSGVEHLTYSGMVQIHQVHFFLETVDKIFVVTIPSGYPFRLVDESYLGYLAKSMPLKNKEPFLPRTRSWKLWGTPFIKELNHQGLLFLHRSNKKDHFQYAILTDDECPEFVSPPPKIEVYKNKKLAQVMNIYISLDRENLKKSR